MAIKICGPFHFNIPIVSTAALVMMYLVIWWLYVFKLKKCCFMKIRKRKKNLSFFFLFSKFLWDWFDTLHIIITLSSHYNILHAYRCGTSFDVYDMTRRMMTLLASYCTVYLELWKKKCKILYLFFLLSWLRFFITPLFIFFWRIEKKKWKFKKFSQKYLNEFALFL